MEFGGHSLDRIAPGQALRCEDGFRHERGGPGGRGGEPRDEEVPALEEGDGVAPVDSVELTDRRRRRRRRWWQAGLAGRDPGRLASAVGACWLVYVLPEEPAGPPPEGEPGESGHPAAADEVPAQLLLSTTGDPTPATEPHAPAWEVRSLLPEDAPLAPEPEAAAPEVRSLLPEEVPLGPEPDTATPEVRSLLPEDLPLASEAEAATPEVRSLLPEDLPLAPEAEAATPEVRSLLPEDLPLASEPEAAAPEVRSLLPEDLPLSREAEGAPAEVRSLLPQEPLPEPEARRAGDLAPGPRDAPRRVPDLLVAMDNDDLAP